MKINVLISSLKSSQFFCEVLVVYTDVLLNLQKEKVKFDFNLVAYIGPRVTDIGI